MTNLTQEQREAIAELERDLNRFVEENVIGAQAEERMLGELEGAAKILYEKGGLTNVSVHAEFAWACSYREPCPACGGTGSDDVWDEHGTLVCGNEWHDRYDEGEIAHCGFWIPDLTWRNPIRRLRLKLTGTPGRCPEHGTRLQRVAFVEGKGVLTRPLNTLYATVVVE